MIEINLIPDIKQEYLKSQRMRARVVVFSITICLVSIAVVVLLAVYMGAQAVRGALADSDIKDQYQKLTQNNPDLGKLVTLQNQLIVVSNLNDKKPMTSRVFDLLLVTNPSEPNNVRITTALLDPRKRTLTLDAAADQGFNAADVFKKTLLNTKVTYSGKDDKTGSVPLTSSVTISNTSFGQDTNGKKVLRFKMSFSYPKELLSNEVTNVQVVTPAGTVDVTDSHIGVPDSLFTTAASDLKEEN